MENSNHPMIICVKREEGKEIAKSIHKGGNGAHQGWKTLYKDIFGLKWNKMPKI